MAPATVDLYYSDIPTTHYRDILYLHIHNTHLHIARYSPPALLKVTSVLSPSPAAVLAETSTTYASPDSRPPINTLYPVLVVLCTVMLVTGSLLEAGQ